MYICEICNTQVAPRVPCNIIQDEVREKTYPARYSANDPGGSGYETVREVRACPPCASEMEMLPSGNKRQQVATNDGIVTER